MSGFLAGRFCSFCFPPVRQFFVVHTHVGFSCGAAHVESSLQENRCCRVTGARRSRASSPVVRPVFEKARNIVTARWRQTRACTSIARLTNWTDKRPTGKHAEPTRQRQRNQSAFPGANKLNHRSRN